MKMLNVRVYMQKAQKSDSISVIFY